MAVPLDTTRILRRLLSSGVYARAERVLERVHPADLAPVFSELTPDETRTVIDLLFKQHRAATTLTELPPDLLPQIFRTLSDERLAEVLVRMEIDDLLEILEHVPEERRDNVRARLPIHRREELHQIELYPEDSAGRVMTTSYLALDPKMSAQEAIDSIRAAGDIAETILYLYVVDSLKRLVGVVPIRRLVAAPPETPCSELMILEPLKVHPDDDQEEVARLVARYDLLAVPVTELDGTMLGVITVDDVIDVITEEATQDMYLLAGLQDEDRVFTRARVSIRKRLPWMLGNLVTVFVAAWVIGLFHETIERVVALAAFLPVVAGLGGNGGIQALTVITRAIALGEIEFSSGLRAVGKEVSVGLALGALLGVLAGCIAWMWQGNAVLGLVLFLSMLITMAVAGLCGAAVPLALKALRQDPALGAGVIVTAVTDILGFLTFLGIASLLLGILDPT